METLKNKPGHTSLALGSLVIVWAEALQKRVSLWVALRDSMEIMEIRREAVVASKKHAGVSAGKKPAAPSEPAATYDRMRRAGKSRVRFEEDI